MRGFAILLVVAHHAGYLRGGWNGVSVFFALSGYLITSLLLGEVEQTGTVKLSAFYRRRVARLAPALLLACVGLLTAAAATGMNVEHEAWLVVIILLYGMNIAYGLFESTGALGSASWGWSLSLEEQFYLIWPSLLRRFLRTVGAYRVAGGLAVLVAAVWVARSLTPDTSSVQMFLLRGDEIALGCIVALLRWQAPRWLTAGAFGVLIVCAFGLPSAITVDIDAACSAVVVAGAGGFARLWRWRPLRHLGHISYALYLWNSLLREPVWRAMSAHPSFGRMPLVMAAVWLCLSLLVAEVSTWLVERPAQRKLNGTFRASPAGRMPAVTGRSVPVVAHRRGSRRVVTAADAPHRL